MFLRKSGKFRIRGHGAGPGGSFIPLMLGLVLELNLVKMTKMDTQKSRKKKLRLSQDMVYGSSISWGKEREMKKTGWVLWLTSLQWQSQAMGQ